MTTGEKAVEIVTREMASKFEEYRKDYGWLAKSEPEGMIRRFFEWGFTAGVSLGIDIGSKATKGEPL